MIHRNNIFKGNAGAKKVLEAIEILFESFGLSVILGIDVQTKIQFEAKPFNFKSQSIQVPEGLETELDTIIEGKATRQGWIFSVKAPQKRKKNENS